MGYIILVIGIALLSGIVQARFRGKFKKYSRIRNASGKTGAEIAKEMLVDYGIQDVQVISTQGMLTDHYNPAKKTVNLSEGVYASDSIAAAAVAAHECGHAVQHAKGYVFLKARSAIVPVVSITSKFVPFLLIGGILTLQIFPAIMLAGIVLFGLTTLFSFITLPVEFDASERARKWLRQENLLQGEQQGMAADALKWAAMTYVVAAISSLATLLYYVLIFMGGRRN